MRTKDTKPNTSPERFNQKQIGPDGRSINAHQAVAPVPRARPESEEKPEEDTPADDS